MKEISFYPPRNGLAASADAAASMKDKAESLRRLVLSYIAHRRLEGATCEEAEIALGMSHQTISPRFTELSQTGRIFHSEARRPTQSGRTAFVYWLWPDHSPSPKPTGAA